MTKLICPECHITTFGTSTPTERDVLDHVLGVHGKNITARGEHRYRARQDKVWDALVKKNDEAFEAAKEERLSSWNAFEKDGPGEHVLEESSLDKLHATRRLLMDVGEDEYGEASEDDHADDVVRDESKAANQRFGTGPGYAESLRYHQNEETRFLAEERMAAFTTTAPRPPQNSHGYATLRQEQLFEDDFPTMFQRSDQSSLSSGSSPDRIPGSILATLRSARRAAASPESSGGEMSDDGEYMADDEEYDDGL